MPVLSTLISIGISLAISVAISVAMSLLFPPKRPSAPTMQPTAPKPEDGKYNLKQNVPSAVGILGRVKKAGDYVFLEEAQGIATHIMVHAAHRINGYVAHYLHDEECTFNSLGWITSPSHFIFGGSPYVYLFETLGLDEEVAFPSVVSLFPSIWTSDHRGDGLAAVCLQCATMNQESYLKVYPQQMPDHSAIVEGALVYDPRDEAHDINDKDTWTFSTNLGLLRMWHLTHPSGGKLALTDLYMPDWINLANVCDEVVLNRDDEEEPRYHGGMWYRFENDPVDIGRTLDEAMDAVLYERGDGTIGVHAGEMVEPTVRLTADNITAIRYNANARIATSVLAVRGRWTSPAEIYNTVDAAIYGDPYIGETTERTKTVDNQAVQSHNHIQRLQALAYTRANAARVNVTVHYDHYSGTDGIFESRFVRVHYPSRGLNETIIEITGRPKLHLKTLTISFEGIIVPSDLYAFEPSMEGIPPSVGSSLVPSGVPVPDNFAIGIGTEVLVGGQTSAFGVASWDYTTDAFSYELEYQLADESEAAESVLSKAGETSVRTRSLRDGVSYRFRLRAWSNGAFSVWTSYETETAVADPVAPGQPTDFNSSEAAGDVTLTWTNPNSSNLFRTSLYRGTSAVFGSATIIYNSNGGVAEPRSYVDSSLLAGTYYYWIRSFNASGVALTEVGPETETV